MGCLLVKWNIGAPKLLGYPIKALGGAFKGPVGGNRPIFLIFYHFFPLEFTPFGAKQALKNCVKWGIDL